jgi:hypothetical protein
MARLHDEFLPAHDLVAVGHHREDRWSGVVFGEDQPDELGA